MTSLSCCDRRKKEQLSDERLIRDISNGSPEKFTDLYNKYQPRVLRFIQGKVHCQEDARDLCQDTFCKVYQALRSGKFEWRPGIKFVSWLYKIAENHLIDQKRKIQRAKQHTEQIDSDFYQKLFFSSISDLPVSPFKKAIMCEFRDIFREILEKLPEKYEKVLKLRYFGGFSLGEISKLMHLPEGKVKPLCYRARMALRNQLLKKYRSESGLIGRARKYNFTEVNLEGNTEIFIPMVCS